MSTTYVMVGFGGSTVNCNTSLKTCSRIALFPLLFRSHLDHIALLILPSHLQLVMLVPSNASEDLIQFSQFSHSVVSDSATQRTAARQASLSITNYQSLLKFMSITSVMPSNLLILCHSRSPFYFLNFFPLLHLPSISPSIRVFSNESVLSIRWPKYWSFSFNISPSSEYSELISFRIDWLHLLAVQGTLKSLLQHHSSKASVLRHSAFFMFQLSYPYMTTGKTTALTR